VKDEPAVTKFQRIFDRSSLLVKSMFTSFWPRPITYCTKYTQQFLKSMTHTICFLTYYIWRGDILPHLDRLGTFVSSSIDGRFFRRHIQASMSITRWCHFTWCFTVLTVKYVSDWRNCHFFDSPAVLAKLLQWMWANKNQSGCGHDVMTCWFEWGKYLSCSVVMAFNVICHHVSKYTKPWGHWKLWQWLSVLTSLTRIVYGASTASPTENYSSLKSLLGGLEAHTPCFTPWKNQSNLVVHPPP